MGKTKFAVGNSPVFVRCSRTPLSARSLLVKELSGTSFSAGTFHLKFPPPHSGEPTNRQLGGEPRLPGPVRPCFGLLSDSFSLATATSQQKRRSQALWGPGSRSERQRYLMTGCVNSCSTLQYS